MAAFARTMSRKMPPSWRAQWQAGTCAVVRENEHGWEPKGPAQLITVRAGVDTNGKIAAWEFEDRSIPWTAAPGMPNLGSRQIGIMPIGQGSTGTGSGFVKGLSSGGDYTLSRIKRFHHLSYLGFRTL